MPAARLLLLPLLAHAAPTAHDTALLEPGKGGGCTKCQHFNNRIVVPQMGQAGMADRLKRLSELAQIALPLCALIEPPSPAEALGHHGESSAKSFAEYAKIVALDRTHSTSEHGSTPAAGTGTFSITIVWSIHISSTRDDYTSG